MPFLTAFCVELALVQQLPPIEQVDIPFASAVQQLAPIALQESPQQANAAGAVVTALSSAPSARNENIDDAANVTTAANTLRTFTMSTLQ